MRIAYGYTIEREGIDPLVELAEDALDRALLPSIGSGVWAVDLFPFRMFIHHLLTSNLIKHSAIFAELASRNEIQKDSKFVGKNYKWFL